jgi:hypothetical protein
MLELPPPMRLRSISGYRTTNCDVAKPNLTPESASSGFGNDDSLMNIDTITNTKAMLESAINLFNESPRITRRVRVVSWWNCVRVSDPTILPLNRQLTTTVIAQDFSSSIDGFCLGVKMS